MSETRGTLIAKLGEEYRRREAAKIGCLSCPYCELGAYELCRHYDLDLVLMDFDAASPTNQVKP